MFDGLDVGEALRKLRAGFKVQREGWNGKGMYLALQNPDAHSANTLPYIWIRTVKGDRVPWVASQADLLTNDWLVMPSLAVEILDKRR